jgi:hypothetical protein
VHNAAAAYNLITGDQSFRKFASVDKWGRPLLDYKQKLTVHVNPLPTWFIIIIIIIIIIIMFPYIAFHKIFLLNFILHFFTLLISIFYRLYASI